MTSILIEVSQPPLEIIMMLGYTDDPKTRIFRQFNPLQTASKQVQLLLHRSPVRKIKVSVKQPHYHNLNVRFLTLQHSK